jgi:hypothetical protein
VISYDPKTAQDGGLFGNSGEEAGFGDHHEARERFVDMP